MSEYILISVLGVCISITSLVNIQQNETIAKLEHRIEQLERNVK